MTGEMNLATLLRTLTAKLQPDTYVFATLETIPTGMTPRMIFVEDEGITLICTRAEAQVAGIAYSFPCRMITLEVHSALEAVGFIAHIAARLAAAGMGVNPVAGYFHDHLFIPEGREDDALAVIDAIAKEAQA